jgi:Tol biopolymer transport system component
VGGEIPYQIYRVRRDGNDLQPLTALAWTSSPVWSPDGRWVIFVGRADDSTWDYQVFQMRPDGSDFRVRGDALAPTSSSLSLSWSPDGHWFTLVNPKGRLYRAEIEGDRVEDLGVTGWYPVWSPDGHWIAFFSDMGGTYEVYRMHPDGSDVRQVTHFRANLRELVWKPPIETHFSGILLLSTGAFCLVIGSIMPECVYRQVRVRAILQIHPDPVRDT